MNLSGDWAEHILLVKSSYQLVFEFEFGGQHLFAVVLIHYK